MSSTATSETDGAGLGRRRQSRIYSAGARGRTPSVPTDPDALERRARRSMSRRAWAYVAGGAGQGRTMRHNREAFERWRILPRVLHGVGSRDLRTDVLGTSMPAPLLLAPIGAAELVRADSDVLVARGAVAVGTPYVFSNQGCNPMEQTAQAMSRTPFWYLSRRYPGRLVDNLRSALPRAAVQTFLDIYSNPFLSWDHLATVKRRTRLPVLIKGIVHPDDARQALELGMDGIIVSNHGGRQVDNAAASLDALLAVRKAVGPEPVVLFDSGIRSGADLFVALALGADACLLGRPQLYGLALAGVDGVRQVIENVLAELDLIMGLTGVARIGEIGRDHIQEAPTASRP